MANYANYEFEEYLDNWADYRGFRIIFLDQYNDPIDEEINEDMTLRELVEDFDEGTRIESEQIEIYTLDADPDEDEPILFWDGNTWDFERA